DGFALDVRDAGRAELTDERGAGDLARDDRPGDGELAEEHRELRRVRRARALDVRVERDRLGHVPPDPLSAARGLLDVAAELVAHRREHLLREGVLPSSEAVAQPPVP